MLGKRDAASRRLACLAQIAPSIASTVSYANDGDPQSIGLVADVCQPERPGKSGHFLVASLTSPELDIPTTDFLKSRGVFELPPQDVCSRLVRLYFHHAHPFFPVIDASAFLDVFENIGAQKLSLHLLWSVFLAAANASIPIPCPGFSVFAEDDILRLTGFSSRKAMKKAMFLRSKALYDAEYERNKTTRIQANLLMGFWYADTEDRLGPWHWNAKLDPRELGEAWERIPISRRQKYFPVQMEAMIPLWVDLVDITIHQAEILSVQHRVLSVRQSTPEVERIEATRALLTLYRPFMLVDLGMLPPLDGDTSERPINATKKLRTVAQHTNNILGNLIVHDMLKVSQALICIAIVPALLTHLLHASSAEKAARQLGWHYLALCMMAVEELRKTYFGAEILFKLFTRAQEKMQSQHSSRAVPSRTDSVAESPRRNTHQPRPLSPPPPNTTWTAGGSSLVSPTDNIMSENYDVEWILSQCMFPDLSSVATWDQQQDTTLPEAFNP
ncbi:hypothetical protein CDEST_05847 [Colletotrichum destructivum]|uniref:Xylanolytic transcriptional activator regulatory domain-containing protein n=1 Tax=Colletotrichum destructivum TaxID=34406 RepID=A0AAX4ID31_9PEZI|nr:hypothetical protein CDEST_05847 [Colletotrichum destructivum]